MKTQTLSLAMAAFYAIALVSCQQENNQTSEPMADARPTYAVLGYESKEAWGSHIVTIALCDDCHTPKVATDNGLELDHKLRLSGHPAGLSQLEIDRAGLEKNGNVATNMHLTAWAGAWGMSFAANLTPHETGIGNWSLEQFTRVLREGKFKGMPEGRDILPPMPWTNLANMTDDEIDAVFAFLKSLPPVDNLVPAPLPPVSPELAKN
jgi:hypothetical protein